LYEAINGLGLAVGVAGKNAGTIRIPRIVRVRTLREFGNLSLHTTVAEIDVAI